MKTPFMLACNIILYHMRTFYFGQIFSTVRLYWAGDSLNMTFSLSWKHLLIYNQHATTVLWLTTFITKMI